MQISTRTTRKIAQRTEGTTGAPDTSNLKTFFMGSNRLRTGDRGVCVES